MPVYRNPWVVSQAGTLHDDEDHDDEDNDHDEDNDVADGDDHNMVKVREAVIYVLAEFVR